QGGVGAHLLDLGAERGFLGVVQQDERVRDGAACGDAVAAARFEIRGGGESGEVGGAGGGDGGVFVGTAATHLDDGAPVGRGRHPRGGGGDGAVVVEDRQHQGLQQHALGEGAAHGEDGGAGEVQLTFGVTVDVTGEAVVGEPVERGGVDDGRLLQLGQFGVGEAEVGDGVEDPLSAGDHTVSPTGGQPPCEQD